MSHAANHAMTYEISQRFFFDAAHTLQRDIEAAGSRRVHGHTYHAEVSVSGMPNAKTGMVMDLGHVRQAAERVRSQLDHHLLDEVAGLGAATLENLCGFIWQQLSGDLPGLSKVRVWRESVGDSCTLSR
ncbi:MAG: 6-carboxytetrahydropterin synthase QueD [Polaromonas sp.]|jgi:6-pyruvoyltetrahydropterin/6-carboxytetrahydropterin synthase|nr:6-carboxytetrahydropterin synthase QueD [Polaromonas sp.]